MYLVNIPDPQLREEVLARLEQDPTAIWIEKPAAGRLPLAALLAGFAIGIATGWLWFG